jgi:hypothetical protein
MWLSRPNIIVILQAFRDEAEAVGAAKKAQRAADKAARDPDDVQLNVIQKVMVAGCTTAPAPDLVAAESCMPGTARCRACGCDLTV